MASRLSLTWRSFAIFSFFFFVTVGSVPASEQPAEQWWETSSLASGSPPEKLLLRTEGRFAYDEASGNVTGKVYDVSARQISRYWRLTNHLYYRLERTEQELGGGRGRFAVETENLSDELRLDLFRYLYGAVGYNWTQDDIRFIDKRHTYFAGLGSDVTLGSAHVLSGAAYFGYEELTYTLPIDQFDSTGWLFQQSWKWQIHPGVRFIQDSFYLGFAEDSERYRWRLNYGFLFPLSQNFSLTARREISYDNQPVGVAEKKDKGLSVGVQFAF